MGDIDGFSGTSGGFVPIQGWVSGNSVVALAKADGMGG